MRLHFRSIEHRDAKSLHYDIVRKENDNYAIWLESAPDLSAAESRIHELTEVWPGEFQVVDRQSHRVVASLNGSPQTSGHHR